jgi:benzoyl-CoA reductase/2-hydroxyglutaryl-CoA dehydratase subunit BcrC/BadD/HgdB
MAPAAPSKSIPLALVGGPLLRSQLDLFDTVESVGGRVALNATEPSERCLLPPLRPRLADQTALAVLADHYFDHAVDVFHRPNSRLYAWLGLRLAERRVRGIVLWVHVGCDLWRAEAASLREAFGLPIVVLDGHEARGVGPRDLNRLCAFVESLG